MLTVKQAAAHACVCESIIRGWVADGTLPHYRLGAKGRRGKILIAVGDLDQVLAGFKVSGAASVPPARPVMPARLKHLRPPS